MRWALPQPFADVDHTADVGVAVQGSTAEETLARLVLAESALLAGGGEVEPSREHRVAVVGRDRASVAVECLRELLFLFSTSREIAAWCEVESFDERSAVIRVGAGRWDTERHAEGVDLKAVTWHAAAFEQRGALWHARVIFDI